MTQQQGPPMAITWPEESKGFCDFNENIIIGYGIPKIGKTTFFSSIPKTIFLETEPGTKHVAVRKWEVRSWVAFQEAVGKLVAGAKAGTSPFVGVCIDTADNLGDFCIDHVCKTKGLTDLSEGAYGSAYAAVTKEFKKQINALVNAGYAIYFTSHAEAKEVDVNQVTNPFGAFRSDQMSGKRNMIVPTASKRIRKFILGLADMILFMEMDKEQNRVIRAQPTLYYEAGDRSGRLGQTLPLDYNAVIEAYYGGDAENILSRIESAKTYLAERGIKPISKELREDPSVSELQTYLAELRISCKAAPTDTLEEQKVKAAQVEELKLRTAYVTEIKKNEELHYPVSKAVKAAHAKHMKYVVDEDSDTGTVFYTFENCPIKILEEYRNHLQKKSGDEFMKIIPLCQGLENVMKIEKDVLEKVRKKYLGKVKLEIPLQLNKLRAYHTALVEKHQIDSVEQKGGAS